MVLTSHLPSSDIHCRLTLGDFGRAASNALTSSGLRFLERTKRESINYQIWRREQLADLEIKAEYMTKEELEEEQRKLFEFQKEHTYEILQGKYNTTGPSNSSIKKENEQQENSSNEYVEPTTTFIYEED